jgi:hypothetical protein
MPGKEIGNPYLKAVSEDLHQVLISILSVGTDPSNRAAEVFDRADSEIRSILGIPSWESSPGSPR